MTKRNYALWAATGLALTAPLALTVGIRHLNAADHGEAPGTTADQPADITDVYAWHDAKKLVAVIDFSSSLPAAGQAGTYDANTLFTLNIDNNGDNKADFQTLIRFGQNNAGAWGIKVEGLPGSSQPIIGPVETNLDAGGGRQVFVGLRDDPFFFDLDGFHTTLDTGTLSFDKNRDTFAGKNVTSLVLEADLEVAVGTGHNLQVWATTARKGS